MTRWQTPLAALAAASMLVAPVLAQEATAPAELPVQALQYDEFGATFIVDDGSARTDGPFDVWLWDFSDKSDALTQSWGWDTSATLQRFDCAAGTMGVRYHETYLAGAYVTTDLRNDPLAAPRYPAKQTLFDAVCGNASERTGPRFENVAQARNWADRWFADLAFEDARAIQKQKLWHIYHDDTSLSAVNIPPPLVAPTQPVKAVQWMIGEMIDGYETRVGMTTVDCVTRSITHSMYVAFAGPDLVGTSPSTDTTPEVPEEETFDWLLVRHACDPVEAAAEPAYADFKAAQAAYAAARTTD